MSYKLINLFNNLIYSVLHVFMNSCRALKKLIIFVAVFHELKKMPGAAVVAFAPDIFHILQ